MTQEELTRALEAVEAYIAYHNRTGGANTLPELRRIHLSLYGQPLKACSRTILTVCYKMRNKINALLNEA